MSNIDMNTTDSMNKNPDFELPVEPGHGTIVGPIIPVGKLSIDRIETSDTISEFMEKVNNNFTNILNHGGGPRGVEGDQGHQGVPTKPKVPIHVWIKGEEYLYENSINGNGFEIDIIKENELSDVKYQEGHLIILENAHVYRLDNIDSKLQPKFITTIQSYDPNSIINGKNAYVHFAYANSSDGEIGFITAQDVMGEDITNKAYMGVYSDNIQKSSSNPHAYTWARIQGNIGLTGPEGPQGPEGPKGPKGDPGDNFTGHSYTIDLEGDISTISIDIDRTILYNEDYCECIAHAYYGNENVFLNTSEVTINLPDEYKYSNNGKIVDLVDNNIVGVISKEQSENDVIIKFTPDKDFIFPNKSIIFPITVNALILDESNNKNYIFKRDLIWTIKGIVSSYELEILPQYRTIKLDTDGNYYPEKLIIDVYKIEDSERTLLNFENGKYEDFTLLYKNYNSNQWLIYSDNNGVDTKDVYCLEFKVVRYYETENEEIWDYEDVWVVADGKSVHYYHADLGSTESMMVLTTGEKENIGSEDNPKYCAVLKNQSGYSITFDPKFYDGTEELTVTSVNIGHNSGESYYNDGTFVRELEEVIKGEKYKLTITKVPYGIEMIPINITVNAEDVSNITKSDTISFNIYISTLSDIYTLLPSVSAYNTSTGKDGDIIECSVFKNNTLIDMSVLNDYGLSLKYIIHDGETDNESIVDYTEPLKYGDDDDIDENEFTAKDVAIVFILSYRGKEVVRSTVPLIKDGIDGKDGDSWQYIFCRSPYYPFERTGISNPSGWVKDPAINDSNSEYLGIYESDYNPDSIFIWYDDHKGVDSEFKYEYQSYRKWDKDNKCWGKYGEPTLYSNYSESGSGYSVILSNPIAVIPVGNDWCVDENNKNQTDSTLIYLYNNTSNISANSNVSISLPNPDTNEYVKNGNFIISKENGVNKVIFRPVVEYDKGKYSIFDFVSNTQYKLPITVRYDLNEDGDNDGVIDNFISTVNWTLSPIKGLEDVELFVDKRVVNTSVAKEHTFKVGYYLINSNGNKNFIENADKETNSKNYQIILTNNISDLSSGSISDWQNVTYNFIDDNGENRNCYVVLVDSDGETIIDYINVISVNDGNSAIHLELTQDYISLPANPEGITDENGAIHPDYNTSVQSIMRLYNGDKLIEYDSKNPIEYSFKINGEESSNISADQTGGFTIPKSLIEGDTNIECIATYNKISYSKILFIDLEDTPYELELNRSILTKNLYSSIDNTGKIVEEDIIVRVKCWMNSQWHYIDYGDVFAITPSGIRVKFGDANQNNNYNRTLYIKNSNLNGYIKDTEIKISFIFHNKELSYETIGIINNGIKGEDGKDGTAPSLVKTTILGYSLYKDANEDENINFIGGPNSDWKLSIDELGTLEPCTTIYILNQYEWSDGNITRGITVTLSGTQGIEGKSRVLFYLGSYYEGTPDKPEKPTLSGGVSGFLNNERCDYYIDYNGDAWMRIGEDRETYSTYANPAVAGGENFRRYWKAADKVGFLQAGAITADMINTGSITADSALVTTLFAEDIIAKNLKVTNANIEGKLSADQIVVGSNTEGINDVVDGIIQGTTIDGNKITTGTISADKLDIKQLVASEAFLVNAAKITGVLEASNVKVLTETLDGKISANNIDVDNLTVKKLNTKPDENKHSVVVQDNKVLIKDDGGYDICKFCDDEIDANLNDAFKEKKPVNITYRLSTTQNYVYRIDPNKYKYKITHVITNINPPVKIEEDGTTENTTKYNFGDRVNNMIASNKIVTFRSTITSNINVTDFYNKSVNNKNCKVKVTVKPIITVYRSGSDTPVYTYTHIGEEKSLDYNNQTIDINSNIKFKFITPVEDTYSFTLNFYLNYVAEDAYVGGIDIFTHSIPSMPISNININFGGYANNTRSEIYKNGMLIQNEINGILVCEGGILLKFNNYGIKLDANGISYATNLLDYQNDLSNANWTTNWSNLNK